MSSNDQDPLRFDSVDDAEWLHLLVSL